MLAGTGGGELDVLDMLAQVQGSGIDPAGTGDLERCLPNDLVQPGSAGHPLGDVAPHALEVERSVRSEQMLRLEDEKTAHVHRGSIALHSEEARVEGTEPLDRCLVNILVGIVDGGLGRGRPAAPEEVVKSFVEAGDELVRGRDGRPIDVEPDTRPVHVGHQADVHRRTTGRCERIELLHDSPGDRERLGHAGDVTQCNVASLDHPPHDADRQRRRQLLERRRQALTDPDGRFAGR